MITLHVFGPAFGLPDPSPFVTKADVLLKLAGVPYETTTKRGKAPKGKLPYLEDAGAVVPDSTFIRSHLERKYGVDFDEGLSPAERGAAWAFEKMCEEHLYWAIIQTRWMDDANFDKGPRVFFERIPMPLRLLVIAMVRRGVRKSLHAHGMGRHTQEQIDDLAARDIAAIAAFLGDKPYLMGDAPCGADATIFAFVTGCLCALFPTPIQAAAARHANLVAYRDRGLKQWYPGFKL
jgi:glutathione S-transferase